MRIDRVEVFPLLAELKTPFRFGHIERTTSSNVLVRLQTADGHVGWGEACPVPQLTAETPESIVTVIEKRVLPVLLGRDPTHWAPLVSDINRQLFGFWSTRAAIETALLDLVGQTLGTSLSSLLGGRYREAVDVHGSVGWDEDPAVVAETAVRQSQRYTVLKLYAGRDSTDGDLHRIEAARTAVGPEHPFLLDVNGLWSVVQALGIARSLANAGVVTLEQPVSPHDSTGMAEVTRVYGEQFGIEVVADESVRSTDDVRHVAISGAAHVVNVGLTKLGGPATAHGIAAIANAMHLRVMVGSVVELGVATAAGLHLSASIPELAAPSYLSGPEKYTMAEQVVTLPPINGSGSLDVPTGPGLGIEVDEDSVRALDARHRSQPSMTVTAGPDSLIATNRSRIDRHA